MDKILIQVDESPTISNENLSDEVLKTIQSIISQAKEAQHARLASLKAKAASERSIHNALEELHSNPAGLAKCDLLAASDSINLSPIILKIQNYLKKENKYSLKKRKKNGIIFYYLQPTIEDI